MFADPQSSMSPQNHENCRKPPRCDDHWKSRSWLVSHSTAQVGSLALSESRLQAGSPSPRPLNWDNRRCAETSSLWYVAPPGGKYCTQCGIAPIAPAATPPGTGEHAAAPYPPAPYPPAPYPPAPYPPAISTRHTAASGRRAPGLGEPTHQRAGDPVDDARNPVDLLDWLDSRSSVPIPTGDQN